MTSQGLNPDRGRRAGEASDFADERALDVIGWERESRADGSASGRSLSVARATVSAWSLG
jgi:hypothetical protein